MSPWSFTPGRRRWWGWGSLCRGSGCRSRRRRTSARRTLPPRAASRRSDLPQRSDIGPLSAAVTGRLRQAPHTTVPPGAGHGRRAAWNSASHSASRTPPNRLHPTTGVRRAARCERQGGAGTDRASDHSNRERIFVSMWINTPPIDDHSRTAYSQSTPVHRLEILPHTRRHRQPQARIGELETTPSGWAAPVSDPWLHTVAILRKRASYPARC